MPEINPQELKVAENRRRFTEIYRSTARGRRPAVRLPGEHGFLFRARLNPLPRQLRGRTVPAQPERV